jgi:hypothetical protein
VQAISYNAGLAHRIIDSNEPDNEFEEMPATVEGETDSLLRFPQNEQIYNSDFPAKSEREEARQRAAFRWRVISLVARNPGLRVDRRHVIAENTQVSMHVRHVAVAAVQRRTVIQ